MEKVIAYFLSPLAQQDPLVLFSLMGIIFVAAFVTSGFGIGGGVVSTPLVILLLPPKFGIALLAPLMVLMSGTGVRQYWKQWDNRCALILLPASLVGIWGSTYLLAEVPAEAVKKAVGVLAVSFGALQYIAVDRPGWKERLRPAPWQGVGLGFASGITSALAHVGGIVLSFYLLPHSRTKEIFVGTTVFIFFTTGLLKLGAYLYYGLLTPSILLLSLTLIPTLILGSILGKWLNRRIPNRLFLRTICLFVGFMGLRLILT
jgi:uncharacterized membrane protein YfcA